MIIDEEEFAGMYVSDFKNPTPFTTYFGTHIVTYPYFGKSVIKIPKLMSLPSPDHVDIGIKGGMSDERGGYIEATVSASWGGEKSSESRSAKETDQESGNETED